MATDRLSATWWGIPAAAALLLWPALWNGYPIVFADTGTYLSQAVHHYTGWDRPVFYSFFMLPLHATITVWPVVVVQALLAAWVMWLVCRVLVPRVSGAAFVVGVAVLSACTWLPWIVSELMPDLFTPLLVLVLCLLGWMPERLGRWERLVLAGLATFLIASQLSSLPLAFLLVGVVFLGRLGMDAVTRKTFSPERNTKGHGTAIEIVALAGRPGTAVGRGRAWLGQGGRDQCGAGRLGLQAGRRWLLMVLPPALAVVSLCIVNFSAHGRFAISPHGNVFLLARVIYDGPGMVALRRDCPARKWLLCPFVGAFPETSDDFLWTEDSPLNLAGGPKLVSAEVGAIIGAAVMADPGGVLLAALGNAVTQLREFASGDGLTPWPAQISGWIERDFPAREAAAYASARQQRGILSVPAILACVHQAVAVGGVIVCAILLPVAVRRRAACAGFLLLVLVALPVSAAITGGLSAPHDRYQSRIMWLPPFIASVALMSMPRVPGLKKRPSSQPLGSTGV